MGEGREGDTGPQNVELLDPKVAKDGPFEPLTKPPFLPIMR